MKFEETFERYLAETTLRRSSKSVEEITDKLAAIQRLRSLYSRLKDFIVEEGVPDTEEEEPVFFDFVIRREGIKFGIFIEVTQPCPQIELETLSALNKKLSKDPALDAVLVVWNDENLSTCALDALASRAYFDAKDRLISLEREKIGDFLEIVMDFYNQQFVDWAVPEESDFPEIFDLKRFKIMEWVKDEVFQEFYQQIKSKRFRRKEKMEAKNSITSGDIDRIASFLAGILSKGEISEKDLESIEDFYETISGED